MTLLTFLGYILCLTHPLFATKAEKMLDPIVTIEQGQLRGVTGKNVDGGEFYKFFGIPYAQAPVNDLRFQAPHPPENWTGIRDGSIVGDSCLARDDLSSNIIGSEDCLYLNVYTKNLDKNHHSSLKPVMVFIHGGGLTLGSSRPNIAGPEFLMLKDIVLVTLNYRLGVLGFLSSDDPEIGVPGNMGLKDQNMALKWVQKNIKSFNGDPNKVTIFGNSAGAGSVHAHVLSPASKGLFHGAILQSGCALDSWFWGSKNNAREIVRNAGKNASTEKEAMEILKQLPAMEIFAAQEKFNDSPYPSDHRPFSAAIEIPNESAFIADNPVNIIKSGSYNQVPMMIGYVQNEGMLLDYDTLVAAQFGVKLPDFEYKKIIPVNLNVTSGSDDWKGMLAKLTEWYSKGSKEDRYDLPYPASKRSIAGAIEIPNPSALITESPVKTIKSGNYNQVPMMLGYSQHEGMIYDLHLLIAREVGAELPAFSYDRIIPNNVNVTVGSEDWKKIVNKLTQFYSKGSVENRYDPMTDGYFLVAIVDAIKHHLENARHPIYLYRMSLSAELNHLKRIMGRVNDSGVCHGDELGYLFKTDITPAIKPGSLEDRSLRNFVELWTNFATYGNPTPNKSLNVTWEPVKDSGYIEILDIGETLESKLIPELVRLGVWWEILEKWPLVNYV